MMQGNYLADRDENGLIIQLYDAGLFYGEIFYDQVPPGDLFTGI